MTRSSCIHKRSRRVRRMSCAQATEGSLALQPRIEHEELALHVAIPEYSDCHRSSSVRRFAESTTLYRDIKEGSLRGCSFGPASRLSTLAAGAIYALVALAALYIAI